MSERRIIGCMTGTSLDGLDAALVSVSGEGLDLKARVLKTASRPLGPLAGPLRDLAEQKRQPVRKVSRLGRELAQVHVALLEELVPEGGVDAIAVHGQTVYHDPPLSLQLINPHLIAQQTQSPVVFDLRGADLAVGGQGAPITPLADYLLFRDEHETRAVVNLGGFCNYTLLPPGGIEQIGGGDVCACNQLLDALAQRLFGRPYDEGGALALAGVVEEAPYEALISTLTAQAEEDRSLGTGDELSDWCDRSGAKSPGENLARTACAGIAHAIARAVRGVDRVILAGGGTRNEALLKETAQRVEAVVCLCETLGYASTYREAIAMAVLGALCADRVPITLPQITGCPSPAPVAGCWIHP
ncbi:MAG: anhydro-N-acetylmuramic acid kinase [Phycisphaeraceae bacterium]|nr:anhydro-N-acetylmuramic acid kinase [Phycisphaeraceae bacterium]